MTRLPYLSLPYCAKTNRAIPRPALTRLPKLDLPYHSLPPTTHLIRHYLASTCLPYRVTPYDANPRPDVPQQAPPAITRLDLSYKTMTRLSPTNLACLALTRPNLPGLNSP